MPHEPAARELRARLLAVAGGSLGNLVEWYDWYIYSAFSLYFAKAFFPSASRTAQLLNTAAVFAVGFFVRPIGGWYFGRYGDRHGRRAALTLSVLMMCAGSLLIAVTPGFASIGAAAPVLLLVARVLQGFSVGGEYGASATYLSEAAPRARRGFYSSFQYVTLIMGQLLAIAVLMLLQFVLLTAQQLESWGWRIAFGIGAACALGVLFLQRRLVETPAFLAAQAESHAPAQRSLFREHPREVLIVLGLTAGGSLAFYTFTTYMQQYLVNTVGLTLRDSTLVSAATLFVYMLLQPVMGALSDWLGRKPLLIAFGVLGTLATVPLLKSLSHARDALTAFWLIMAALTIVSAYTAISAIVKAELFPVRIRALGVGLPYAIGVSLFGGTAPYVALACKSLGFEELFYWYVSICIAGSLIVYTTMRETSRAGTI